MLKTPGVRIGRWRVGAEVVCGVMDGACRVPATCRKRVRRSEQSPQGMADLSTIPKDLSSPPSPPSFRLSFSRLSPLSLAVTSDRQDLPSSVWASVSLLVSVCLSLSFCASVSVCSSASLSVCLCVDITSGLQLGRAEVLRGLRNFLKMDRPEHHSIDRLKEREVDKGSGRHSTLQGRKRFVFNQTNIGTIPRATLGRLLRDGAERV